MLRLISVLMPRRCIRSYHSPQFIDPDGVFLTAQGQGCVTWNRPVRAADDRQNSGIFQVGQCDRLSGSQIPGICCMIHPEIIARQSTPGGEGHSRQSFLNAHWVTNPGLDLSTSDLVVVDQRTHPLIGEELQKDGVFDSAIDDDHTAYTGSHGIQRTLHLG